MLQASSFPPSVYHASDSFCVAGVYFYEILLVHIFLWLNAVCLFFSELKRKAGETDGEKEKTESAPPQKKAKDLDDIMTRTGGAYIPPARLRMMQAQITDKSR